MNNKILSAKILHVAKSTSQWESEESVIPKGMLCVEFTESSETKIKIGNGTKSFSELPYTGNNDLENYFTKSETISEIELAVQSLGKIITIKGTADSIEHLPESENNAGDLWFVKSDSSEYDTYNEYIWITDVSGNGKWEFLGQTASQVDLSEYSKKEYVDEQISKLKNETISLSDQIIINCTI